ncbi:hypothetical protein TNCV_5015411 [Trichonephila clavipes]|nr:hypothetical protein TNCV_5015411 [Trichonephila clavipes]
MRLDDSMVSNRRLPIRSVRSEVILSMVELNLDQAPQVINKEEFQFEHVRLQALVAASEPRMLKRTQ